MASDNRGMFGYEGEGYLRGGARGGNDRDFWRSESDHGHFSGIGPKNYQRSDERIREEVCERLTDDHYVDASDIEINVNSGIATLSGTVADRAQKRRAEDVVERVRGVRDVQNDLRIRR